MKRYRNQSVIGHWSPRLTGFLFSFPVFWNPGCPFAPFDDDECGPNSCCTADSDCDDGEFCNGVEGCNENGLCVRLGGPPCNDANCPETQCDESADSCVRPAICDDPCRSQCGLDLPDCEPIPIAEFQSFEDELAGWMEDAVQYPEGCMMVAGECGDGTKFLYSNRVFSRLVHFYSPQSGAFSALETDNDCCGAPQCFSMGYWPLRVECLDARVTQIICGSAFEIGQDITLQLPQASWRLAPSMIPDP